MVVIEHNLEVIKTADWILDLGPEGGDKGGEIVAEGTPEEVAKEPRSYTGQYLKEMLARSERVEAGPAMKFAKGKARAAKWRMLGAGGRGTEGRGEDLRAIFRAGAPTAERTRRVAGALADRDAELRRLVRALRLLAGAAAEKDEDLATLVGAGNATLQTVAGTRRRAADGAGPPAGHAGGGSRRAGGARPFARRLGPTLDALRPAARGRRGGPAARRPAARGRAPGRAAHPRPDPARAAGREGPRPALADLPAVTPHLRRAFDVLDYVVNELGHNPDGPEEGYLFWLAWFAHNANSILSIDDAQGVAWRGALLCRARRTARCRRRPRCCRRGGLAGLPRGRRGGRRHDTQAPSAGRIAVMVGFALSCFGLLLYLWITFGGAVPLGAKGYRFQVQFVEATQLAEQADVRISGVPVGKVVKIGRPGRRHQRRDRARARYAPLPRDARATLRQKTLLGETFVELTPGTAADRARRGRDAAPGNVRPTVELDEVLRALGTSTQRDLKRMLAGVASGVRDRGEGSRGALGRTAAGDGAAGGDLLAVLDAARRAAHARTRQRAGVRRARAAERRDARAHPLRRHLLATTAARDAEIERTLRILPTFLRELARRWRRRARSGDAAPVVRALREAAPLGRPALRDTVALLPGLRGLLRDLDPALAAARPGCPR